MILRHAPAALRNAFRSPGRRAFGARFAFDYMRFALRCARSWGYTGPGRLRLLGLDIAYPNQSHALFLTHEIFVQTVYLFRSSARKPFIVDCGANIGFATLFFAKLYPDARILAIEPDPGTSVWLRTNVEKNADHNVEILQAAAAAQDGTITLSMPESTAGSMTNSTVGGTEGKRVRAVRLSSVIDSPVDFLKLDVEGAEYEILRELVTSGAIRLIRQAAIEFHPVPGEPDGAATLTKLLSEAGMDVRVVSNEPGQPGILHAVREDWAGEHRAEGAPTPRSGCTRPS